MAQCAVPIMEGKNGVPLRFPRPVMALIATGTAAISIGLSAMPASADQVRPKEWWLSSLGVTGAWAASQGSGVTIAVLSDGVNASQADLTGAVTTAPAPSGGPVATGQYFGEQGTAIASLIAGRGHGSGGRSGIMGIAPQARILSVPVTLPADDPDLSQAAIAAAIPAAIANGIRYAVSHGATVIDLPIDPGQAGSTGAGAATAAAGGSPAERAAISYALAHNVVLVGPAGDDETAGDAPNYPAAYPGVIAVGAFNSAFDKAPWSSHQSYVTLTAAGASVLAAASTGGYKTMNSTSAASAVVSGVVALIRSRYPQLSVADIRKALITTTSYRRAGGLAQGSGYGAVDADQAMAAAAVLGAPAADRASAGAQPLLAPAAISSASATQGIGAQILRAGELSAGLLLLLLLMIAAYAATGRRRPSRQPAVTAEWAHRQAPSRYPQASGVDADQMLDAFSAPAAEPEWYAGQPAGVGSHYDEGLFAPAASRHETSAPAGPPAPAGAPEPGGWLSHGPASRAVSRRAAVSGAPPWEPASAPAGELPWATAPGPQPGTAMPGTVMPGTVMPAAAPAAPASNQADWQGASADQSLFQHAGHANSPDGSDDSEFWDAPPPGPGQQDWDARPADPGQQSWDAPRAGLSQQDWDTPSARTSRPDWNMPQAGTRQSGQGTPAGPAHADGYGYGNGNGTDGPADWNSESDWNGEGADWGIEAERPPQPRTAPSGLPVRPTRPAAPSMPPALSPSGSLWEAVESEPNSYASEPFSYSSEPNGYSDDPNSYSDDPNSYSGEPQDPADRPIFVWNPATTIEAYPAAPAELRRARSDWDRPE